VGKAARKDRKRGTVWVIAGRKKDQKTDGIDGVVLAGVLISIKTEGEGRLEIKTWGGGKKVSGSGQDSGDKETSGQRTRAGRWGWA